MDLKKLCAARHDKSKTSDLSLHRVMDSCANFNLSTVDQQKDVDNALIVALQGVSIFTTPTFIPCNVPPPIRQIYLTVSSAVNKTIYDMYKTGLVLLLPTVIVAAIPGVHFSPMHWTKKKDKASGRIIGDVSNDPFNNALNDADGVVAQIALDLWGKIEHPTIKDFANMILL
jgi:hypothetical protein